METESRLADMLRLCGGGPSVVSAGNRAREMDAAEWNALIPCINLHGITPLLYARIRKRPLAGQLPRPVLDKLKSVYLSCAASNARMYAQLAALLDGLKAAGVEPVVLKGACLAECVYGNIALRPMADIDLLVPPQSLPALQEACLRMGYARTKMMPGDTALDEEDVLVFSRGDSLPIDVHPATDGTRAGPDTGALYRRSRQCLLGTIPARIPLPEDLLCHLCFHAAFTHGLSSGALALCDVREVVRRYGETVNWERLRGAAGGRGVARSVGLMLRLCEEVFEEKIAPAGWAGMRAAVAEDAVSMARHFLFEKVAGAPALSGRFARIAGRMPMRHKAEVVMRSLFPPRPTLAAIYRQSPDSRFLFLYYARRAAGLVRRYATAFVRAHWGRDQTMSRWVGQEERKNALRRWLEGEDRTVSR